MKCVLKKCVALLLSLTFVASAAEALAPMRPVEAKKTYKVVLDAGHDEQHIGARYNGLEEEDITYAIAKYCKKYLEDDYDMKVYLARPEEDCPVGGGAEINCLEWRPKVAKKKKADIFVSLHINSSINAVPKGAEVWMATMYSGTEVGTKSRNLAQCILSKILKLGYVNRGLKYANHVVTKRANEYGIPACLVEHGFIRNPTDRRWMSSTAKIKKLAKADADGIAAFLKMKATSSDDDEDYEDEDDDLVEYYDGNAEKNKKKVTDDSGVEDEEEVEYYDGSGDDYSDDDGVDDAAKTRQSNSAVYVSVKKGSTGNDTVAKTSSKKKKKAAKASAKKKKAAKSAGQGTGSVSVGKVASLSGSLRSNGTVDLVWSSVSGVKGYRVDRADVDEDGSRGKFRKMVILKGSGVTNYSDSTGEVEDTYRYRVRAFKKNGKKVFGKGAKTGNITIAKTASTSTTGTSTSSTASAQAANDQTEITGVKWTDDEEIKITWKAVSGAVGYEISRSKDGGKFKSIDEVDEDTHSYEDWDVEEDAEYLYRVRPFFEDDEGEYWGTYSKSVGPNGASGTSAHLAKPTHKIAGDSETSVEQMVAYYESKGKAYPAKVFKKYGAPTIKKFARIVYEESEEEGIKAEVVFAQICKETNFLQFGGAVTAKNCNFAGIGATDGGGKPDSFEDVRQGVRAQVQHLKAYATTDDLENEQVDPRFGHVQRGCAEYVEWLGIKENPNGKGWATAKLYGYSLANDYEDVLLATD